MALYLTAIVLTGTDTHSTALSFAYVAPSRGPGKLVRGIAPSRL